MRAAIYMRFGSYLQMDENIEDMFEEIMYDLPIPSNYHSKENRTALTKMVMKLFALWQISTADQSVLLNRSISTIRRYRKGGSFGNGKDIHDRAANLLNIDAPVKSPS